VSGNDDDEALRWAGGRDPSHYETPEVKGSKVVEPSKKTRELHESLPDEESRDDLPPATSGAVLVLLGILGGVYLLYTVGWFISWQRFLYSSDTELELIAFHVQQVLAILAPPLWFVVTLVFTRKHKPTTRLFWLLGGAVLLVPWSFVFGS
jgi:hypothetical protein